MKGIEWKGFPAVALAIALACVPSPAAASLAVALVTSDRIVMASDSRTWDRGCDCAAGDVARKVDVRLGYGFIMTGWPGGFEAWTATELRARESARELGRRILGTVKGYHVAQGQELEFSMLVVRYGADAYAVRAELQPGGRLDVLQEATPGAPFAIALGWDSGGAEKDAILSRLYAQLHEAPGEAQMIDMATSLLATAASQSPKVGGPSHLAIVDQAGARWHTPQAARDLHWDGTNLTIVSHNLKIDNTGTFITPSSSFDDSRAYAFTVSDGLLRLGGLLDSTHQGIGLQNAYTGSTVAMEVQSGIDAEYSVEGQPQGLVFVTANASNAEAAVEMLTFRNGGTHNGDIRLGGYLQFLRGAVGTAGAVVGYIEIKDAAGNIFKIPVHNP